MENTRRSDEEIVKEFMSSKNSDTSKAETDKTASDSSSEKKSSGSDQVIDKGTDAGLEKIDKSDALRLAKEQALKDVESKKDNIQKESSKELKFVDQDKLDARFAKLTAEIKDARAKLSEDQVEKSEYKNKIAELEKEIQAIKAPKEQIDISKKVSMLENERISKRIEEDKSKPLIERREMTDEELENWLEDDKVKAYEWLVKRENRRNKERESDSSTVQAEQKAQDIIKKQDESTKRVYIKHPELNVFNRKDELRKQGKSDEEIHDTLLKENDKYRISFEIISESKDSLDMYILDPYAPEKIMLEMEKRLSKTDNSKSSGELSDALKKIEELEKKLASFQSEQDRMSSVDAGISSSYVPSKSGIDGLDKEQLRIAKLAGFSEDQIKKRLNERKKILKFSE